MKNILLLSLVFVFSLSLFSQELKVNSGTPDGIAYKLPAKAFVVHIDVERTDYFRGPLADYAEPLLGIQNPVSVDKSVYRIINVRIIETVYAENKIAGTLGFVGERNSREKQSAQVMMNDNGTLAGLNIPQVEEMVSDGFSWSDPVWNIQRPDFEFLMAAPNQVMETDTIVKFITVDTATMKDVSYKHRLVARSEEDKANEIVEKILKIRRDRMSLLSGYQEVAYSEGTIRYMDGQFQEMENSYLSLFRGASSSDESRYTFVVFPSADDRNNTIKICNFSDDNGISQNNSGQAITVTFATEEFAEAAGTQKGVVYRIPATSEVTIKYGKENLGGGIFTVPQFGVIKTAPAASNPKVLLSPNTGAALQTTIE
jgi:hypothetical protein